MSQVFHEIEKKIITSLRDNPKQSPETLEKSTQLSPDQIRRGIEWLRLKDLAIVTESKSSIISLGKNGIESFQKGLPERRLLNLLKTGPKKLSDLQKELGIVFGPSMGLARKNNWVEASSDKISIKDIPSELPGEKTIKFIGENKIPKEKVDIVDLSTLLKRPDFIIEDVITSKEISLSDSAKSITLSDSSGEIDVEAKVPETFVARTHPLKDTINEIREIFVTLGFSEILGNMTQSSFWNFDALFTPQDHPARELQDTFYLDKINAKKIGTPEQIRKVSESHKKNWRYQWDINEARKMVLRTHTTCITIKHLAENKPDEARFFSLGRVFRNEKVSYKHLVEFNQIEGVVVGALTGFIGAGGGFLIIPALVILAKTGMKVAVATSLIIIAFKSLTGFFLGDALTMSINWTFLFSFTMLSFVGIFIGSYLSNYINGKKLKKGFGYFIFLMAAFIFYMEFFIKQ